MCIDGRRSAFESLFVVKGEGGRGGVCVCLVGNARDREAHSETHTHSRTRTHTFTHSNIDTYLHVP